MALERTEGSEAKSIPVVTGRITIEIGITENGERCVTHLFEDLCNLDEDGNPHLLGYFDGKMALGTASDEFMMKHFFAEDE